MSADSLEVLRLRRDVAVLEVEMTEQRQKFIKLILDARKLVLFAPPFPDQVYQADRREWLHATETLTV